MLLAARAAPNAVDADSYSPLYLACQNQREECVASLLAGGAMLDLTRPNGAR